MMDEILQEFAEREDRAAVKHFVLGQHDECPDVRDGECPDVFAASSRFPTRDYGMWAIHVTPIGDVALVKGEVAGVDDVLVRVQSACMPSTALNYDGCECREQIDDAMRRMDGEGRGVLVYLTGQEGRGNGLVVKVHALVNKLAGMDTHEAVAALGVTSDVRSYGQVPVMLRALRVGSVRLLSENPAKHDAVKGIGDEMSTMMP